MNGIKKAVLRKMKTKNEITRRRQLKYFGHKRRKGGSKNYACIEGKEVQKGQVFVKR